MDLKAILDAVSTAGALGFAIWILSLFLTDKLYTRGSVDTIRAEAKERLEEQKAATKEATEGWKASVLALNRLADTWEATRKAEADLAQKIGLSK